MAESGAPLWAAVIGGIFALLGVLIGGWLAYATTKKAAEQQSKEAKKVRKIAQLESLNRLLEKIQDQTLWIAHAAKMTADFGKREEVREVDDASMIELEFLTRVYLPEGRLFFYEIRSLQRSIREKLIEIYTSTSEQLAINMPVAEVRKLELNFQDSVEHLREALVESARAIERQ